MDKEKLINGVTVVWCSTVSGSQNMRVAGFYKNATVFKEPQYVKFESGYEQEGWYTNDSGNMNLSLLINDIFPNIIQCKKLALRSPTSNIHRSSH